MTKPLDVLLVSMPFGPLFSPSLALSLLQPQVGESQITVRQVIVRRELHGVVEGVERVVVAAQLEQSRAHAAGHVPVARVEFRGSAVQFQRALRFAFAVLHLSHRD